MNIDTRINEIKNLECRSSTIYKISTTAGLLLYASLFIVVFENHRLLAVCVTFCLAMCLRFVLHAHDVRVEGRVLRELKQASVLSGP